MEHIYVIQLREFVRLYENTFKIGKTSKGFDKSNTLHRIKSYPKDSVTHAVFPVQDCTVAERAVFCFLNSSDAYTQLSQYGNEYFHADNVDNLINDIQNVLNDITYDDTVQNKQNSVDIVLPELLQNDIICNEFKCKYCIRPLSSKQSKGRHENTCKYRDDEIRLLELQLKISPSCKYNNGQCRFCKKIMHSNNLFRHEGTCKQKELYNMHIMFRI